MSYVRLNPAYTTGTPTLESGVAYSSDSRFGTRLVKFGNIVILNAALELTGSGAHFSTAYTNVMTLPSGFRPATRVMVPVACGSNIWNTIDAAKAQIQDDGTVSIYSVSSRTDLNMVQISAVFTTA